jgi:hypothetical protein
MRKSPGRLLNKMPNRSMTADVNNLQHAGYKPVTTATGNPQHTTSTFSGFLFDDDDHQSKTASGNHQYHIAPWVTSLPFMLNLINFITGMVPPYSDTTYITQYGDNADSYSFTPHDGYTMVSQIFTRRTWL